MVKKGRCMAALCNFTSKLVETDISEREKFEAVELFDFHFTPLTLAPSGLTHSKKIPLTNKSSGARPLMTSFSPVLKTSATFVSNVGPPISHRSVNLRWFYYVLNEVCLDLQRHQDHERARDGHHCPENCADGHYDGAHCVVLCESEKKEKNEFHDSQNLLWIKD